MRKYLMIVCLSLISFAPGLIFAQSKISLDDRTGLVSTETENLLKERLLADSLDLTSLVDMKQKCQYWFAEISGQNDDLVLKISDCNQNTIGEKNLGSRIKTASPSEASLLLYFNLTEILMSPGKYLPAEAPATTTVRTEGTGSTFRNGDAHRSRYFFAPSSYNLEQGDLYYNTLYFFVHDIQYGVSDRFSLGMGTTILGNPFYLTPKYTIPLSDGSAIALGDLMIIGTWYADFFGNLVYGTYTKGQPGRNVTIGGGYLFTNEGDLTGLSNAPVLNLSFITGISDHIYFLSENYASQVKLNQYASYYYYDPISGSDQSRHEDFIQNMFFIYGQTGFRFINKQKDVVSWQLGLSYIFTSFSEYPAEYDLEGWYNSAGKGKNFVPFPVVGYTRKFGAKY